MRLTGGVLTAFGFYLAWLVRLPALDADPMSLPSPGGLMLTASLVVIAFVVAVGIAKLT